MEDDQNKRKNLLAIDGGTSGLPALLVLDEMFSRIEFDSKPVKEVLPCQKFDMISATGPGAIVAILIGKLKFTVSKAIDVYSELASAIPNEPAKNDEERRENMKRFEEGFSKVMKEAGTDADTPFLDDKGPKILICALNTIAASNLYPLRSYRSRGARPAACSILQVACASIASPDRFLPVTIGIGHKQVVLTSAMVAYANPTKELLRDAEEILGAETEVATVLSIGAGRPLVGVGGDVSKGFGIDYGLLQGTISSKQVHEEVQKRFGENNIYFRFNVDHEVGLEPEVISAHISDYLGEKTVSTRLDDAIKSIEGRSKGLLLRDINSVRTVEIALEPRPPLVENFVGRRDILDAMHRDHITNRLPKTQSPVITVLFGLGGSGKTQTALKFALEYENLYPNAIVFYLNAGSKESIQSGLGTLIQSRGPEHRTKTFKDALMYLAKDIQNWLVILDNADDPSVRLFPFIPTCTHGNVIITTRNSNHAILSIDRSHHIQELSTEDAVKLILNCSHYDDTTSNRQTAERIASKLGHLPLALFHAGTYIYIHKCLNTYLDIYQKSKGKLLSILPWEPPSTYQTSVATTIQMSFEKLSQGAQDVIRLLSHLDSASIAHEIIAKAALSKFDQVIWTNSSELQPQTFTLASALRRVFCPNGEWSEADFNEFITQVLQYSLLRLTTRGDSKFYSMHALVQSFLQQKREPIRGCEPGQLAVRILGSSIEFDINYKYLAFNRLVAPHASIIQNEDVVEAGDLFGFGSIFYDIGNIKLSEKYWEQCVEMWRSSLGEEHEATFMAMSHLSNSYRELGKYEKALELDERVLEMQRRALGPEHRNTLITRMNIAHSYRSARRYQEAVQLLEGVLEVQRRVLGPMNLDALDTMSSLSSNYASVNRHAEALELIQTVANLRSVILGIEHPHTLSALCCLAASYWNSGKRTDALILSLLVMGFLTSVLGPEHPETLSSIRTHFDCLNGLGMTGGVSELIEWAVPAHERGLGMDHPETIKFKGKVQEFIQTRGTP